jgi:hypothetical protein
VAYIQVLPAATPVTKPVELTVAIEELLDQVTFWLGALLGLTVALSWSFPPIARVWTMEGVMVTAITLIVLTTMLVVFDMESAAAVIVTVPVAFPMTSPLESTVAILGSELLQVGVLMLALFGRIAAVNWVLPPTKMLVPVAAAAVMVMLSTAIGALASTVTTQEALLLLAVEVALIVALPAPFPFTTPSPLTAAIASLELDQVRLLSVVERGRTLATIRTVPSTTIVALSLSRITPVVAEEAEITVMTALALRLPSFDAAVIVALPVAMPVTTPPESTVATAVAELVQLMLVSLALEGLTAALSVRVEPTLTDALLTFRLTADTAIVVPKTLLKRAVLSQEEKRSGRAAMMARLLMCFIYFISKASTVFQRPK